VKLLTWGWASTRTCCEVYTSRVIWQTGYKQPIY